ncbi:MAG TPA: DUF169 domain-containing protein [Acidobacteriaceae bacterium]|jgi:uncharacterized protein (DUF169 family)|nr:DUF169 domain-containing protein [Acidobacteriaceae bacterium]
MREPRQETNYAKTAEALTAALHLRQNPVAICFTDSVPDGVRGHDGPVPAGCRFWEDGASATFATSAADHSLCAIGVYTHNLQPSPAQQTDLMDALKVFGELGYVTEKDLALIPVLPSQPNHVVYSPLSETPLPPDVVLLFVHASQTLILSEATQQVEQQNAPAMGRPACAVVPQVMRTGRAALSLGCCGARAYLDTLTDDVAIFAIPGAKLEAYTQRIEALAKANAVLAKFHEIRRRDVGAGQTPTIKDSLAAMGA